MKRNWPGIVALALVVVLLGFGTASAVKVFDQDNWFDVIASGPISVESGGTLSLTVEIKNFTEVDRVFRYVQATVIDPFSGTRVYGPAPTEQTPGKVPAFSSVKRVLQIGPITESNKTLGVIIMVLDNAEAMRGAGGWGFVVQ